MSRCSKGKREVTTQPDLWSFTLGEDATAAIARCVPVIRVLAEEAGVYQFPFPSGITVANVRHELERRGWITNQEKGRRLSWLGPAMRAAGLKPTGHYRRSDIPRSHGNLHMIWTI
jgi:hypothetical protein